MYHISSNYHDLPSMFLIAASAYGLLWLTGKPWFARLPRYAVCLLALVCLAYSAKHARHVLPLQHFVRMDAPEHIRQLNSEVNAALEAYAEVPPAVTVFATGRLETRFALRKKIRTFTSERASQPFSASMVFFSYLQYKKYPALVSTLIAALDANPTLRLVNATEYMRVYTSKDLETATR